MTVKEFMVHAQYGHSKGIFFNPIPYGSFSNTFLMGVGHHCWNMIQYELMKKCKNKTSQASQNPGKTKLFLKSLFTENNLSMS